jgi:hypothetical protein
LSTAFNVKVYIMGLDAAWLLVNATIGISYNSTVVDVVGGVANVTIDSNWLGPNTVEVTHSSPSKLNITARNPAVSGGDVLVATIKFTVINHGKTYLTFFNYHLYDYAIEIPTDPPLNGFVTTEKGVHDLAVASVKPYKSVVGQGYIAPINVTVKNVGNFSESFSVTVYANTTLVQSKAASLLSGDSIVMTFLWNTSGFTMGKYRLRANATVVVGEVNASNNNLTDDWVAVAIIGDITGPTTGTPDGKVDIRDIALVAKYFGQTVPPAPPNCDITGPTTGVPDGKVDIRDIAIVAKNFGKAAP